MTIKFIPDSFNKSQYNNIANHPLQTWEWGETRKKTGIEILRIGEFDKNILKKVFLMTIHTLPYINFKIGYIPRSVFPDKHLIEFLKKIAIEKNIIFIKLEPYVKKNELKNPSVLSLLKKSSHPLFPSWTIINDISKSEEELNKKLRSKTRYNIKIAQKKGVVVKEESNNKGYEIFENLYFETIKRQKYFGHTKKYHQIVWNEMKNKISNILISYHKDEPLGAYELFTFKETTYYVYGGSSEKYRNFMASNLLMWQSILFAKNKESKYFDMWGSLAPDYNQTHPWSGFTRFKEGYGGEYVELIGSYDLITKPLSYKLYNLAFYLRRLMFGI
jgi:lipid II:glycine glycyltransferase (peptidoglycan interpeptide bridge formation enzyme)